MSERLTDGEAGVGLGTDWPFEAFWRSSAKHPDGG
jgi:hypothetical protein